MDSRIEDYLKKKYGENYGVEAQARYDDSLSRANTANLFGNIGEIIAGQRVGGVDSGYDKIKSDAKENTIGKIEKDKKQFVADYDLDRKMSEDSQKDALSKREQDVNSEESKLAQSLAVKMGMSPQQAKSLTAAKWKSYSPALEKMYEIDQKKLDRADARATKQEERSRELITPYGEALTKDDAKNLKAADEEKKNFDQKITEMIALRKKHKGGAILNREDVARGQQLSKDALLAYKNMAKLGVLSQADEAIINAIIPADPLEYNSIAAAVQGQDPILNNLTKFKADSDADFHNRLVNRLAKPPPKKEQVQLSDEDRKALEWANANPNDERAKRILQKLSPIASR